MIYAIKSASIPGLTWALGSMALEYLQTLLHWRDTSVSFSRKLICVFFYFMIGLLSGCSGNYPNPLADGHAKEIKAKCESLPPITINGEATSRGVLFHGMLGLSSPEEEILKRRLTFLEVNSRKIYANFSNLDKIDLQKNGVTRYYFADTKSEDCKEFNKKAAEYPFTLIPLRRLGLPASLCIAKKINVPPESQYFYYIEHQKTSATFGEDLEHRQTLANFETLEKVAEVVGFQYCDSPRCWHGAACWRDSEKRKILTLAKGIPDARIAPQQSIETISPKPFKELREATMVLVKSSNAPSRTLSQSASGNRSATTNANATVYITELYENRQPMGSFSLTGYALEVIHQGRPRQIRIRAFEQDFEQASTLRVSDKEITFVAAPARSGFRQLNEMFFRYSREAEPLSVITLNFKGFDKNMAHKYYFDEANYENGKISIALLEASIDDHYNITVLKRHEFQEQ